MGLWLILIKSRLHTGNGSPHEETCRVCLKPGDLYPCRTCRPAFHPGCIPDGSLRDPQGHLFCALCVRRGWNVAPPALTPPPTPGPAPARQLDATAPTTAPAASAMSIPSLVTVPLENNTQRQFVTVQQAQELAGSVSSPNPTDYHALQPQPTTINLIGQSNSDVPNDGSHRNTETSRPKRQRKSRFATLPSEVDASLAVLYRELESVASLKTQVEDLQIQNIQYLQGIKIRDNNLAVLRRDLENRKAENEELARLRANTSEHDSLKAELEELRSKNAQLEADLQVAREQTATAQELVNDWKGKLTQLIGIS